MTKGSDIRGLHGGAGALPMQVDATVAVLTGVATALTAGALFSSRFLPAEAWGPVNWVPPLVSGAFFVALLGLLVNRRGPHAWVRGLLGVGSAALVASGLWFVQQVGVGWVTASCFAPAFLGFIGAALLGRPMAGLRPR